MKALLIVAHGSRRASSNDEVRALTALVAQRAAGVYARVDCAFLELADPLIPAGIETLARSGASDITVLPYFLSAGRHVVEDIPAEVAKAAIPGSVRVRVAPYVGGAALAMAELLLAQAQTGG